MAYKAIIFDFFDVIHRDPFQHWLKQNHLDRDGELHQISKLLDIGDIEVEEFHKRASKWADVPPENIKTIYDNKNFINTEMLELIKSLKVNYKIGLLSNASFKYIDSIIQLHEIEHLFDEITISATVRLIKPDPAIFEHILDKLGVKAEEAIFIDDNPKNVEAASKLGITGIVYKDIDSLKQELGDYGVTLR